MEFPAALEAVEGAKALYDWFGHWPSFHDAEVICLHLNRRAASLLVLHTWEMTKEVDDKGYFVLAKHVVVEFLMNEVTGLSLNGFNGQNVVFGLALERTENGYRLALEDCHGIAGEIEAKNITIRLTPGKPKDI
jgi:immunity protein 50 of polymorphic toxin system